MVKCSYCESDRSWGSLTRLLQCPGCGNYQHVFCYQHYQNNCATPDCGGTLRDAYELRDTCSSLEVNSIYTLCSWTIPPAMLLLTLWGDSRPPYPGPGLTPILGSLFGLNALISGVLYPINKKRFQRRLENLVKEVKSRKPKEKEEPDDRAQIARAVGIIAEYNKRTSR